MNLIEITIDREGENIASARAVVLLVNSLFRILFVLKLVNNPNTK